MIANVLPETLVMMDFIVERGGAIAFPDNEWLMESLVDAGMKIKYHVNAAPNREGHRFLGALVSHGPIVWCDCPCHKCLERMWSGLT